MELVQNKLFYHIQVLYPYVHPWGINDVHHIGSDKNYFMSYFDTFPIDQLADNQKLAEYAKFSREIIFEEIRQRYFPHLPSRHHCIWLIPANNMQAITFWKQQLTDNNPSLDVQILQLECTGIIHYANQKYVEISFGNMNIYRDKAYSYWLGTDAHPDSLDTEGIFEGTCKVKARLATHPQLFPDT